MQIIKCDACHERIGPGRPCAVLLAFRAYVTRSGSDVSCRHPYGYAIPPHRLTLHICLSCLSIGAAGYDGDMQDAWRVVRRKVQPRRRSKKKARKPLGKQPNTRGILLKEHV